jgi:integrase
VRSLSIEALGHASVSITLDIYSHVLPSMSRTAADAIEAAFGELHG